MNNSLTYNIYKSLFFIHKDKLRQFNTSYICLDSNITYCFNQTVSCSSVSGRQAAPLTADLHLTCVVVSPSSQSQRSFPETADEPSSAVQSGAWRTLRAWGRTGDPETLLLGPLLIRHGPDHLPLRHGSVGRAHAAAQRPAPHEPPEPGRTARLHLEV